MTSNELTLGVEWKKAAFILGIILIPAVLAEFVFPADQTRNTLSEHILFLTGDTLINIIVITFAIFLFFSTWVYLTDQKITYTSIGDLIFAKSLKIKEITTLSLTPVYPSIPKLASYLLVSSKNDKLKIRATFYGEKRTAILVNKLLGINSDIKIDPKLKAWIEKYNPKP